MTRTLASSVLALSLVVALPTAGAFGQSYNAPAGIPAAAAPGGNVSDAVQQRDWNAPSAYNTLATGSVDKSKAHKARGQHR